MNTVYIVTHTHELPDGHDDIKFIGAYESKESAEQAVKRAESKAGFSDAKEGFYIGEYPLGKDHWEEGFFTYTHNSEIDK